jgi:hypothetical protein
MASEKRKAANTLESVAKRVLTLEGKIDTLLLAQGKTLQVVGTMYRHQTNFSERIFIRTRWLGVENGRAKTIGLTDKLNLAPP